MKDGSVDFSHVTFAYQQRSGKPVLSDIDLHIHSGETIGVMGGTARRSRVSSAHLPPVRRNGGRGARRRRGRAQIRRGEPARRGFRRA
ncbi:MAG: hypothetical protein ACLUI3_14655 [Christensenellales bacterium]